MKFKSLAVKHLADNTIPNDSVLESRMEYFVLQFNKEGDKASVLENGYQDSSLLDAVSRTLEEPKEKSFETWSLISRLTEEKTSALQQNQKLQHELELMRKQISKKHAGGVSLLVAFLIGLFGILVGYIFK
ncbi:hypothetical protein D5086_004856 [Populus alba]|uniref:Uncharacterized protein n=1 Tax=Populus alba TaxID=43335 RepID=A0ACC4CS19_POPAL